jgi:hypothetical protein
MHCYRLSSNRAHEHGCPCTCGVEVVHREDTSDESSADENANENADEIDEEMDAEMADEIAAEIAAENAAEIDDLQFELDNAVLQYDLNMAAFNGGAAAGAAAPAPAAVAAAAAPAPAPAALAVVALAVVNDDAPAAYNDAYDTDASDADDERNDNDIIEIDD